MATKIITKNSSTTTAIPTAGDLVQGELAVNVTDKRLFTENAAGAIVELGTNPSTLTVTGAATFSGNVNSTAAGENLFSNVGNVSLAVQSNATDKISIGVEQGVGGTFVASGGALKFRVGGYTAAFDKAQIDASGNLLVGTTSNSVYNDVSGTGIALNAGELQIAGTGTPLYLNRQGSDGTIAEFRRDGTTVGSIGYNIGSLTIDGGASRSGLYFGNGAILPRYNGGLVNGVNADLGATGQRFQDLYLSGTVDAGAATFSGPIVIPSTSYFKGNATQGYRFNNAADTSNLMILQDNGNLLVGTFSSTGASAGFAFNPVGSLGFGTQTSTIISGFSYQHRFYNPNGQVGYISTSGSATSYTTSSDYRLKEDDVPMTGATERVKALRPINFAWKVDGSRTDGFFAHEAQEVVPEAATGTKDAMRDEEYEVTPAVEEVRDEDGNVTTEAVAAVMGTRSVPDYQGIDQSKLVPLLTAALQEAIAKIEALTARLEALEGA